MNQFILILFAQEEVKEEHHDGRSDAAGGEDRERYDTFLDAPTHGIFTEGAGSNGEGSRVIWGGGALSYRSHADTEKKDDESQYQMLNENEL